MNYEEMTIEDINERVSSYFTHLSHEYHTYGYEYVWNEETSREWDGCTNPSDAWTIIVENDITVRGGGVAYIDRNHLDVPIYVTRNENPLRAAMICFLKMKDAEK